jgi:polysaccharide export outer membrane protein
MHQPRLISSLPGPAAIAAPAMLGAILWLLPASGAAQQFAPVAACQTCGPNPAACLPPIAGVDCAMGTGCGEPHWNAWGPIPWQAFAQGEYTGPARLPHVPEYRLRVDDEIEFVYRLKREELARPYLLDVGDEIQVDSLIDEKLNRRVMIQPDGTADFLLLGPVRIVRKTIEEARAELNELYKKYYRITDINLTRV